ncbi:MAG: PatA/PatG family cyanobactin maturation protease [Lewinellaceae bacterium]|nr:PatA/PatG family cyanobactin maturation protease [Lewinellaceae bacterium]
MLNGCENILRLLPDLAQIWERTKGVPEVKIAVLDGVVELGHTCFGGAGLEQFPDGDQGVSGHGTHVASIIFGQHGSEVCGISPNCSGLFIPIFKEAPDGNIACSQLDLARAITKAVEAGAHIINISGGEHSKNPEAEDFLNQALRLCNEKSVLVVAAAGNDGCACIHIPAASPIVLAVGAMDSSGTPLDFSNWGSAYMENGILAPGYGITGAKTGGGVQIRSGTSYAAPIISGIAGLLLSEQIRFGQTPDPIAIKELLLRTTVPCPHGDENACLRYLKGKINLSAAFKAFYKNQPTTSDHNSQKSQHMDDNQINNPPTNEALLEVGAAVVPSEEIPAVEQTAPASITTSQPDMTAASSEHIASPSGNNENDKQFPTIRSTAPVREKTFNMNSLPPLNMRFSNNYGILQSDLVDPSECSCQKEKHQHAETHPQLVYALGTLNYEFINEARRDSFIQNMPLPTSSPNIPPNPDDPLQMIAYLTSHKYEAASLIWTLNINTTPIYSVYPTGPYSSDVYDILIGFLRDQHDANINAERISIPGVVVGKVVLMSGQEVPAVSPEPRGMYNWRKSDIISQLGGTSVNIPELTNFLNRLYYEIRNLGISSQDRAINYSATNAFQAAQALQIAFQNDYVMDTIRVERSPVCRPGSDCWDVVLTFFKPQERLTAARRVFRYTIDVSDVVPVSVGEMSDWYVY